MGGVEGGLCTKGGYLPGSDHGSLGSLGGGGMATCGCGRCRDMAARCKTLRTSSRCAYQTRRRAAGADVIESCPSAFVLPRLDLALDPIFPVFIPCLLESTSTS